MARQRLNMARKGRQAVRNGGLPGWLLVLIGIIIGAIAVGIVMRMGNMPISRPENGPQPATAASSRGTTGAGIAADSQSQQPRYDFYSVLPEKEVVIPDAKLNAKAKAEKQAQQQAGATAPDNQGNTSGNTSTSTASTQSGQSQGQYLLQVGSFPKASDAEALKAKLALKGFRAEIQTVSINGQTWNRVRLGPYASASALQADKQKLEADGIHAIALKEH